MGYFLITLVLVYAVSIYILPFPHWPSYRHVLKCVLLSPVPPLIQRLSMLRHLIADFLVLPLYAFFWAVDDFLFPKYKQTPIPKPVFIMSQPRSGTTFLLRTLSQDSNSFLSLQHMEWRYPSIAFWKLLKFFGLRQSLENKSYWPNTPLGKTCEKIHHHTLGVVEEFGIFLEERLYKHYFTFRRFPFPEVLAPVTNYSDLSDRDKEKMIRCFTRVVQKVFYFRGNNEIFLTKENESVDFYELLADTFPDARFLFIVREPAKVLDSYRTMSITCTEVKHGWPPESIPGWHQANMRFREIECRKFIEFYNRILNTRGTALVTFNEFTNQIEKTVRYIYKNLDLELKPAFARTLRRLQKEQERRNPGYTNMPCENRAFDFYDEFVKKAESRFADNFTVGGAL